MIVEGNGVFDNRDHGLFIKNQVTVEENDIVGNQRSALQLERNPQVTVSHRRISKVIVNHNMNCHRLKIPSTVELSWISALQFEKHIKLIS